MKKLIFSVFALSCLVLSAQQATVRFSTNFVEDSGTVKAFNGVQGGPISVNSHDADLTEHYVKAGIKMVRFPYGDGFNDGFKYQPKEGAEVLRKISKLTISDIFPDRDADPDDPSSYNFSDIDKYVAAIKKSGAEPVWQAIYDIGKDSNGWMENGVQYGKSPADMTKWNTVVYNILRHFNNGWARGNRWNIKYVEFYHDPAGVGGYDFKFEDRNIRSNRIGDAKPGRVQLVNDFIEFVRMIEKYNSNNNGDVKAIGPGLDSEYALRYIPEIMNKFGALKINPRSIIFSYRDYNPPQKLFENASFIRKEIDRMVLGDYRGVPIWNVEWNWFTFRPPLEGKKNVTPNEVSSWIMAHNIQSKTLAQPYWSDAILYRLTRASMCRFNPKPQDSLYFNLDSNGEPKPAYFGLVAMDKIAKETPVRLSVKTASKDSLVTVLAAKSQNGRKLHLLVAYWNEKSEGVPYSIKYSIDVENFSQKEGLRGKLYVIDKNTKAFQVKKDVVAGRGRDGYIAVSEDIPIWSAHLFEFER